MSQYFVDMVFISSNAITNDEDHKNNVMHGSKSDIKDIFISLIVMIYDGSH